MGEGLTSWNLSKEKMPTRDDMQVLFLNRRAMKMDSEFGLWRDLKEWADFWQSNYEYWMEVPALPKQLKVKN